MTSRARPLPADPLAHLEPFARMSVQSKALLAHRVVRKRLPAAAIALYKGQPVAGAYFVLTGRLRVFATAPNGTEATLYFINPGETCVLALNCLFNDLLYPAWVSAEAATTIAIVPGPVYRKLFDLETVIRDLTVQALSTLVFRLMAELDQVHTQTQHLGTTREVVARLLAGFVTRGLLKTQRGSIAIRDLFELRRVVSPDAQT